MTHPHVNIDLHKIEHNARTIVGLCQAHGIEVTGVTKVTCGDPEVAKAMLRGGVSSIGESRLENIHRLRAAGVHASYLLLRLPPLSEVDDIVAATDISLNSELSVLVALSQAAQRQGRVHEVILMVDLGDLREGLWPNDLIPFVRETLKLPGIRIGGLGTNLTCFGGVIPSEDNMHRLVALAEEIERTFGLNLARISGINSSGLELIASGHMPKRVNHARIGEAILLGVETVHHRPWPGTFQDAFLLSAEVLELKEKPSLPQGQCGEDAFGHLPTFENHGEVDRAILNIGREDVEVDGLTPIDPRLKILGASSDYLVMDVTAAGDSVRVGDRIAFSLNYGALLAVMSSQYVEKRPLRRASSMETAR
jgi:predicted amino acid racemase